MEVIDQDERDGAFDAVALYFALKDDQLIDLEVAAAAAIEWSRGLKLAAASLDSAYQYRVTLIAAAPGSSKWMARIERARTYVEESRVNKAVKNVQEGWEKVPVVLKAAVGLGVALPMTAVPTYEYWTDSASFSPDQVKQIEDAVKKVRSDPAVSARRQAIYKEALRDTKISGIGAGIPDDEDWKPSYVVPANQFADEDGFFSEMQDVVQQRTLTNDLDVVLVTPRLENAPRVWSFRQEGIPGNFTAAMRDEQFLAALDRSGINETLRANIPMRIRLEVKQELVNGEWQTAARGRSVIKVLSPRVD